MYISFGGREEGFGVGRGHGHERDIEFDFEKRQHTCMTSTQHQEESRDVINGRCID